MHSSFPDTTLHAFICAMAAEGSQPFVGASATQGSLCAPHLSRGTQQRAHTAHLGRAPATEVKLTLHTMARDKSTKHSLLTPLGDHPQFGIAQMALWRGAGAVLGSCTHPATCNTHRLPVQPGGEL